MKKIIVVAFAILSCTISCTKEEIPTANITLNLVHTPFFGPEGIPVFAVLTTDIGVYEFKLIPISGGEQSHPVEVPPGAHKIQDISLYDNQGKLTHYVYKGIPPQGSIVVTWVNDYTYTFKDGTDLKFQILPVQATNILPN